MPIETKKVKAYSNVHKPWITLAISKSIRRINNLYKNYLTKKSVASNNKYKKYKNKLTNTIWAAERNFYHGKFSLAKQY